MATFQSCSAQAISSGTPSQHPTGDCWPCWRSALARMFGAWRISDRPSKRRIGLFESWLARVWKLQSEFPPISNGRERVVAFAAYHWSVLDEHATSACRDGKRV